MRSAIDFGTVLAAEWNGAKWTAQPTPAPAGSVISGFKSVSCPSSLWCEAVGSWQVLGPDLALAEGYAG